MNSRDKLRAERNHEDMIAVLRVYKQSVSATEVSKQTGLTTDRVLFLIRMIQQVVNLYINQRATHLGLSVRTLNALGNHNITTRSEARAALESGEWKTWRNFGARSADELRRFLEDGSLGKI